MAKGPEVTSGHLLEGVLKAATGSADLRNPPGLPREIAPGVYWLSVCNCKDYSGVEVHSNVACYLIIGTERTLLVDMGFIQNWPALSADVARCLDGRPLDYLFPTHAELPHGGNLGLFMEQYPEAIAIGDLRDYALYFPQGADRMRNLGEGAVVDLGGGYRFHTVEAVFKDMPNTLWGYEESQKVLFVSDGFSYIHYPELVDAEIPGGHMAAECGKLTSEGVDFPSIEAVLHYTTQSFYWARFRSDADVMFERFAKLCVEHPTKIVAPAHGNVVDDLDRVVPIALTAHKRAFR